MGERRGGEGAGEREPRRGSPGFSLVEIMVALVVFAIGVLGLAGMIPMAMRNLNQGAGATHAQALAQGKLEELVNASGDLWLTAGTSADTLDGRYVRSWTITADAPMDGMTSIAVAVEWEEAGTPQRLSLATSILEGAN